MKSSLALIAAGAALAAAQTLQDLPQCGQTCISNMIQIASSQLGCTQGNVTCYCTEPDFGYGIRDCSNEACPNQQDAQSVISFGVTYCSSAISSYSATLGATTALTATGSASPSGSGSASTSTGTGSISPVSTAITTRALTEIITTGGSTITSTTGSTTIYAVESGSAMTTSALTSVYTSGGSTFTTTTGSTTIVGVVGKGTKTGGAKGTKTGGGKGTKTGTGAGKTGAGKTGTAGGNNNSGGKKTSTSGGAAPIMTAAPGLIGAAALAVMAL